MKKLFTLSAAALSLGVQVQAQNIVNGDVEIWNSYTALNGNPYLDLGPNTDRTQNFLRSLNDILSAPLTPATCFRVSDVAEVHNGTYSVRVLTKTLGAILIPGYIGTGDVNITTQSIALGRAYAFRPTSLNFWYKYNPVNGDSAAFYVEFTKWDALNQQRIVVGTGSNVVRNAVTSYTQETLTINYLTNDTPDSVNVILCSSGGYNLVNLQGSVGQENSELFLDDINFAFPASVNPLENSNLVKIFPTVAAEQLHVNLENMKEAVRIRVYDMQGRMIQDVRTEQANNTLSTQTWAAGAYTVLVQTDFHPLARVKVVKP